MASPSKEKEQESRDKEPIFNEILASDSMYGYSAFAYNTTSINVVDPTVIWTGMQWDPWLAMTVYDDMEEKDDAIASSLETRKDAVLALTRRVLPASKSSLDIKIAAFV